jgi:methylmalonyl-CoA mutase cobalamin-binding domain/chain
MKYENVKEQLQRVVREGRIDESAPLACEALKAGADPLELLDVVVEVMKVIGDRYGRGELFIMELMMAGEAASSAMNEINKEIVRQKKEVPSEGRIILATVEGDIHDIGKNIVGALISAEGYEVIDLGVDVPNAVIIEKVRELQPEVLGLSALLTNTQYVQGYIIDELVKAGLREEVKVIVGGASVDDEWAEQIGADAFGADAIEAIEKVKSLTNK